MMNPFFIRLAAQANLTGFSGPAGRADSVRRSPETPMPSPADFIKISFELECMYPT